MIHYFHKKYHCVYRITFFTFFLIATLSVSIITSKRSMASEIEENVVDTQQTWSIFQSTPGLTGRVDNIPLKIKPLWSFPSGSSIESGVAIGYGKIYLGTVDGQFFALNQNSGEKEWELSLDDSIVATPLLPPDQKDPLVFIGSQGGVLIAVKALTGEIVWSFDCGARITSSATFYYDHNNMRIVFGAYDFKLHCLDALTGKELWQMETENFINGTPALSGHFLTFGGCDNFLRVIDIRKGTLAQVINLDSYLPSSPAAEKETVWVANYDGTIFSVDMASGNILWKYLDKNKGAFLAPLAISSVYMVAADQDGRITILDKKAGERQHALTVSGQVSSGPIVDEKNVLIADQDGFLTVFELETGKQILRLEHGSPILAPLAIIGNRIYVGDNDGNLTVYGQ